MDDKSRGRGPALDLALATQPSLAMQQVQIEVLTAASLGESLRADILSLCSDAYEEDFGPCLDLLSDAVHVLARVQGRLVAHAAWVERELRAANLALPLRAAYVEAVAVPIALQGRGYGTEVLAAIPPLLGEFDIAALSPSEAPYYERLGWELWRGPLTYMHGADEIATPEEEVMILRLPKTPAALNLSAGLSTDWRAGDVW